jgi:hypothetical protein
MTVVAIEYVDYGAQGEYGFFGKVVARSTEVREFTEEQIEKEIAEMKAMIGSHIQAVRVEEVPACFQQPGESTISWAARLAR